MVVERTSHRCRHAWKRKNTERIQVRMFLAHGYDAVAGDPLPGSGSAMRGHTWQLVGRQSNGLHRVQVASIGMAVPRNWLENHVAKNKHRQQNHGTGEGKGRLSPTSPSLSMSGFPWFCR